MAPTLLIVAAVGAAAAAAGADASSIKLFQNVEQYVEKQVERVREAIRLEGSTDVGATTAPRVFDRKKIDAINTGKLPWRAVSADMKTHPFFEWTVPQFKRLLNKKKLPSGANGVNDVPTGVNHKLPTKNYTGIDFSKIPDRFDAREKWFDCQTVGMVRDQGDCGSCWAFGTTTPMSDRVCIASNGTIQDMLSARDLMGCCSYCTSAGGCEGGDADEAYYYWMEEGIVSGDNYGSELGCQPYPIPINLHHSRVHVESPKCVRECTNGHTRPYAQDKFKAKEVYHIPALDVKAAQWEIMTHGPITGVYDVYEDFPLYKDGVYIQNSTELAGAHDISLMGWGEENGVKYWLAKNSWNRLWGHHGFFKIRRGTNECNMETSWMTGIPDV